MRDDQVTDNDDLRLRPNASEAISHFSGTAATAPKKTSESRIGDDETHARLQAARNAARRNPEDALDRADVTSRD